MFAKKRITGAIGIVLGTAVVAATAVPAAGAAAAAPQLRVDRTISSDFVGPLQFAVNGSHVFVADDFTSTLSEVGVSTPIATNPGEYHDIAGVAVDPKTHAIAYTTSTGSADDGPHSASALTILRPGHPALVVDLFKFEQTNNPDGIIHYGVDGHVSECVRNAIEAGGGQVQYTGGVDSHPYAVASLGDGSWAVADAGGNDILRVEPSGKVVTLAVLPAQPVTITADIAQQNGLPSCTIGVTYRNEAVPTDVEVGPEGKLYVSILAGGIAPFGSVYTLSATGYNTPHQIATGIPGATNLAVSKTGNVYVASLYTGEVFEVPQGASTPVPVLSLPGVAGLEWANNRLYASTAPAVTFGGPGAPPPGTIVLLGEARS